ncbi:MAG: NarK/NasA family nitrate transporter [Chloroflexi bacterium]|nr:NarK/NasA family nitrate transporter [Chloroflexota bacterium]
MLVLATLAFAVCFAVWGLVSPLAPLFRTQYQLSGTEVGLLVAVPVVLGSLARIPLGLLTDRFGGRVMFPSLLVVACVPVALAGLTSSFGMLLADSLLLGLAGASFAVGVPFVARWFPPQRQGFALGVYGMGNIGTAAAALAAPRVAASLGWQVAFWMWIPVLLVMAEAFWLLARDAPGFQPNTTPVAERFSVFGREPLTWVLALFYFVTFGGFVAMGNYLPTLLVGAYGLDPADAATRASGFVVLATLARPVGGILADRWGGARLLNITFAIVAAFAILLAFGPGMALITTAFLGCAFMLGLGNGAVFKLVAQHFPREAGVVTGVVGAAGGLGGFFPPLLMGFVRDVTGAYAIGFMLLSEFALLCLLVNVLVLQQRARVLMPHDVSPEVSPARRVA